MSAVYYLLVGIHEYIFQKISDLFFKRSSTENLSPAWVSFEIIPSRSSKPADMFYLSTFQVIFTRKIPDLTLCVFVSAELQNRGSEAQWYSQRKRQPFLKCIIFISCLLYLFVLCFFLNQRTVAKSTIIHWLTQSTCLSQCCCCLNIIDFTYQ